MKSLVQNHFSPYCLLLSYRFCTCEKGASDGVWHCYNPNPCCQRRWPAKLFCETPPPSQQSIVYFAPQQPSISLSSHRKLQLTPVPNRKARVCPTRRACNCRRLFAHFPAAATDLRVASRIPIARQSSPARFDDRLRQPNDAGRKPTYRHPFLYI